MQKKSPAPCFQGAGPIPGDDLLSQDLSSHYHRRCGVSLPGSEWDRVVPPRSGHQRSILLRVRTGAPATKGGWRACRLLSVLVVVRRLPRPLPDIRMEKFRFQRGPLDRLPRSRRVLGSIPIPKNRNQAERMISSARLHVLPRFHLHPIDVVVFDDPSGKTHLGRGLALRCFQRLSLPHLATRPCS